MNRARFAFFKGFYEARRCPHAPANPARAHGLALKLWDAADPDRKHLNYEDFYFLLYTTLLRLFRDYDPAKYKGKMPTEEHFLVYFGSGLAWELKRAVKKAASGRRLRFFDPARLNNASPAAREGQSWRLEALDEAVKTLGEVDVAVLEMTYRDELSARDIGRRLRMHHSTVGKVHRQALDKLKDEIMRGRATA